MCINKRFCSIWIYICFVSIFPEKSADVIFGHILFLCFCVFVCFIYVYMCQYKAVERSSLKYIFSSFPKNSKAKPLSQVGVLHIFQKLNCSADVWCNSLPVAQIKRTDGFGENVLVLNDNKSIHPEITISSSKTSNVSHNSATEKYLIILNEKSLSQSVEKWRGGYKILILKRSLIETLKECNFSFMKYLTHIVKLIESAVSQI